MLTVGFPDHSISLTLRGWVNDGLMAIFFFVVGLEIKRELRRGRAARAAQGGAAGHRRARRDGRARARSTWRSTPAAPARGAGASRWPPTSPSPSACSACSARGSSPPLKLFLLALAIVDDIGAIVVIAFFYSGGFDWATTLLAVGLADRSSIVLRRIGRPRDPAYVVVGIALWLAIYDSGFHATLAGVILGLLAPTQPFRQHDMIDVDALLDLSTVEAAEESVAIRARVGFGRGVARAPCCTRGRRFVIVPLFALANAGLVADSGSVSRAASSSITHGVVVGLVVGKLVGISLFGLSRVRLGIGELP